jgi:Flp pilus assembly protein TadG
MPSWRDESGLVASELAVLAPALLLLMMLAVQAGLWAHANQLADVAANAAVLAASAPDADAAAGRHAAAQVLAQAGHLDQVTIEVERDATTATAHIAGRAPHLIPIGTWTVAADAAGPVERFIPEGQR